MSAVIVLNFALSGGQTGINRLVCFFSHYKCNHLKRTDSTLFLLEY